MVTATFCPNCYHPEPGQYCPQCGQEQKERRTTVRALVGEFVDEQFGVNNRLPRTLRLLLFRPGFLTNDYFDGRIRQYIPPLRLYLLTSLVFFALFLLAQSSPVTIKREADDAREQIARDRAARGPTDSANEKRRFIGVRIPVENTDNWVRDAEVNLVYPPLTRAAQRNLQELAPLGQEEATRRIVRTALAEMPKVFFVLLPIYAFLLFIFFHKQRRYYVEHFVFALHLHAFAFLAMLPLPIFDMPVLPRASATVGDILFIPILLFVFGYIFLALKRVYRQGWLITGAKYVVLWALYMCVFSAGVLVAAVLALTTV
jgi:hypothetical protein